VGCCPDQSCWRKVTIVVKCGFSDCTMVTPRIESNGGELPLFIPTGLVCFSATPRTSTNHLPDKSAVMSHMYQCKHLSKLVRATTSSQDLVTLISCTTLRTLSSKVYKMVHLPSPNFCSSQAHPLLSSSTHASITSFESLPPHPTDKTD